MKPNLQFIHATLAILLLSCQPQAIKAEVRLPGFFGDHMVMQRDIELRIWGWCDAGEEVSVTLNGQKASTKGSAEGTWKITLPAMQANSKPLTLQVKGDNVKAGVYFKAAAAVRGYGKAITSGKQARAEIKGVF